MLMSDDRLTVLIRFTLRGTPDAFRTAITRLAARVARDAHPGVLSYRCFVSAQEATARAVIDCESPDARIGHHDIAMAWPGMTGLHQVAALDEVTFPGPLTPEFRARDRRIDHHGAHHAGLCLCGWFSALTPGSVRWVSTHPPGQRKLCGSMSMARRSVAGILNWPTHCARAACSGTPLSALTKSRTRCRPRTLAMGAGAGP